MNKTEQFYHQVLPEPFVVCLCDQYNILIRIYIDDKQMVLVCHNKSIVLVMKNITVITSSNFHFK